MVPAQSPVAPGVQQDHQREEVHDCHERGNGSESARISKCSN